MTIREKAHAWSLLRMSTCLLLLMTWHEPSSCVHLVNSSLACTRGKDKTNHQLTCGDASAILDIRRVFYGATPLTSECSRTAPYDNCCTRDPAQEDCVFSDEYELKRLAKTCSSTVACYPAGRIMSASLGNCDNTTYHSLTSFSFVEYDCVDVKSISNLCGTSSISTSSPTYLDTNNLHDNDEISNITCNCIVSTEVDATLTIEAIRVDLKDINETHCSEELYFQDASHEDAKRNFTCRNENEDITTGTVLFQSQSNQVLVSMETVQNHVGVVFLRVKSSQDGVPISTACYLSRFPDDHTLSPPRINSTTTPIPEVTTTPNPEVTTTPNPEVTTVTELEISNNTLHPGTIAGITLSVVAIVLVCLLILGYVVINRNRINRREDEQYVDGMEGTEEQVADYGYLRYNNLGCDVNSMYGYEPEPTTPVGTWNSSTNGHVYCHAIVNTDETPIDQDPGATGGRSTDKVYLSGVTGSPEKGLSAVTNPEYYADFGPLKKE